MTKVFHIFLSLKELLLIRCSPFLARNLEPKLLDIELSGLVQAWLGGVLNHTLSISLYKG